MNRQILSIIAGGAVAGTAILLGAWWLWWRLPKRQLDRLSLKIRDPKARADVEDNFRKTIGQLLGGAAVLLGAGLAYLQFSVQQQTSQQQFSAQQQASRELLISNQVSKGFEQLGGDKVVVRLGGIYALEGVLNTSDQYHRSVLEALCAFVRDSTRNEKGTGPPATDVQAALTVVGRRAGTEREGERDFDVLLFDTWGTCNLRDSHIPKARLYLANLNYADLSGADLRDTALSWTDLSGANLSNADLSNADLSNANLSNANLRGADLSNANLSNANLRDADLTGAKNAAQTQLNKACGLNAKLDPGLTLSPCP